MHRRVATHLAVLVIGMAVGIGAVAVAQDKPNSSAAAADSRIVRELRIANSRLGAEVILINGVNRRLDLVGGKLDLANQDLNGSPIVGPPVGRSIRDLLRIVCINTASSTAALPFCN